MAKIINQSLSSINDSIVKRTATESLARVALEAPQHVNPAPMYDNASYQEDYTGASNATDPTLGSGGANYGSMAGAQNITNPYDLGTGVSVSRQVNPGYDQQAYSSGEEAGQTHGAALATSTSQNPNPNYPYQNTQMINNSQGASYTANGFAPQDWQQWTRTYMQPQMGQPGEYLNTATTLMTLGRGETQVAGSHVHGQGMEDGSVSAVQSHVAPHWPEITFPSAANGHLNGQ